MAKFGHGSSGNIVTKMIRLYRPSNEMLRFNVMEVRGSIVHEWHLVAMEVHGRFRLGKI